LLLCWRLSAFFAFSALSALFRGRGRTARTQIKGCATQQAGGYAAQKLSSFHACAPVANASSLSR
jgi:hypothetical protein